MEPNAGFRVPQHEYAERSELNGAVDRRAPLARSAIAGMLILSGIVLAGFVLVGSIRELIEVFVLASPRFDFPRSIAFQSALAGYLMFALLRRLLRGDFRLGVSPRSALVGFARAWGIGVAILIAANVADLLRGPSAALGAEMFRDVVLYAIVILILLIPALLASTVAKRVQV
jgi:hypothetical protein